MSGPHSLDDITQRLQSSANIPPRLTLSFSQQTRQLILNGQLIEYGQQVLTKDGLYLACNDGDNQERKYLIQKGDIVEFDRRYNQSRYCEELAAALDRASNTAYLLARKAGRCGGQPGYTLEICERVMARLPRKQKCFEEVFSRLPIHKITVLFENDSFFIEVTKFIFVTYFKIKQEIIANGQASHSFRLREEAVEQSLSGGNETDSKQQQLNEKSSKSSKSIEGRGDENAKTRIFHQKIRSLFECTKLKFSKYRYCYERINILLSIFTRQNKLTTFLTDLNRQVIAEALLTEIPRIFKTEPREYLKTAKKANAQATGSSSTADPSTQQCKLILENIIKVVRTVLISLSKSQISFKIIKTNIVSQPLLNSWLVDNLPRIRGSRECAIKFIQFLKLLSEISPFFVAGIYQQNHVLIGGILSTQVAWALQTLHSPASSQLTDMKSEAQRTLDNLIELCRRTIKQCGSVVNLGRTICKQLCDCSFSLRPTDIEFFTYVCCANEHSRPGVLKFLFNYYRKFFKNAKKAMKGPRAAIVKAKKANKQYLLEIVQSIRKIAEIENIDFAIDADLMGDIELITAGYGSRSFKLASPHIDDFGDCLKGVFETMKKTVKVEADKSKDEEGEITDSAHK